MNNHIRAFDIYTNLRVKQLVEANHTTHTRLADLLGVERKTVINRLYCRSGLSAYEIMKIAEYYNVSADYLLFGRDESNVKIG